MPSYPPTINRVHIIRSFMINWALWAAMCVCLCLCLCGHYSHTQVCVCVQRFVCVCVFDLLTHVFNWNSMQSAYCPTNRICTWWCQPRFFRGPFSVLRSHTVRQDHLAHLTETSLETSVVIITIIMIVFFLYGAKVFSFVTCTTCFCGLFFFYFSMWYFTRSAWLWHILRFSVLDTLCCEPVNHWIHTRFHLMMLFQALLTRFKFPLWGL